MYADKELGILPPTINSRSVQLDGVSGHWLVTSWDICSRIWGLESFTQYSVKRHPGKLGRNLKCLPNNVTIKPCKMWKSLIVVWIILDLSSSVMC
jgi:hypothetical protein